jgi:two-component system chemotaxis response regulator CheB
MPELAAHDVVLVAASAGGVEALKRFVAQLPADLPATVLVALHVPASSRSMLAGILRRRSALPVGEAEDGQHLDCGIILTARPDRHLLIVGDRLELGSGPSENGHRPSHDAMLRSAALALGPRTIGVVLTGLLDDGAAGLATVARYGGRCLVQDPADAEFPSMPRAALAAVPTARPVALGDLAQEVTRMVTDEPEPWPEIDDERLARDLLERDSARGLDPPNSETWVGEPSSFACPACSGVLNNVPDDTIVRFRCRTGHAYSAETLLARQDGEVEDALWTAIRVLQERVEMCRRLAEREHGSGESWASAHYTRRAAEAEASAAALRKLLHRDSVGSSAPPPQES